MPHVVVGSRARGSTRMNVMTAQPARIVPVSETQSAGMSAVAWPAPAAPSAVTVLLPIMAVVLVAFLIIGMALPVLPLHVQQDLGLGTFVVGLVTGSQFVAALTSRVWSGHFSDRAGAKRAVMAGLLTAVAGGLLYFLSLCFAARPDVSVSILLFGRALLGGAESFIITGGVSWGLVLAGERNAGRVIAWIGMAMFAALALGAPLGTALYRAGGFAAIAAATTLLPLAAIMLVAGLPPARPRREAGSGLLKVAGAVWMPGLGSAFSSIGFGAMIAFSSLLSVERNWIPVWLLFSAFAASLVATRFLLGHIPDRLGGAPVALVSVAVEAAGLALIWPAHSQALAAFGALLTGSGFALVYPALGVEAVRRVPPQSHGLAMGAYTAFLDIALGFGTPVLGLIGGVAGLRAVFLAAAVIVLCGAAIALRLLYVPTPFRGGGESRWMPEPHGQCRYRTGVAE
jgi:MFS family permease